MDTKQSQFHLSCQTNGPLLQWPWKLNQTVPCRNVKYQSNVLKKLSCSATQQNVNWPFSWIGQRKTDEGGNWKGNGSVISILHLLIHSNRVSCWKTTTDLHMQQWSDGHYIRTSQIIVAITKVKLQDVSQPLGPTAPDRGRNGKTKESLLTLKASIFIFTHYSSSSLFAITKKWSEVMQKI